MHESRKRELRHVFWIGGSACGAKSSTARALAARYSLQVYGCDEAFAPHRRRVDPRRHPWFHSIMRKDVNRLWMPPPEEQLRELCGFYEEQFDMVVEDVLSLPRTQPLLVEGAGLLPARVCEWLLRPWQTAWLVPTPEFRATLTPLDAPEVRELIDQTDDPVRAYRNWMARDVLFANWIRAEARALGLRTFLNEDGEAIPEKADALARHFKLRNA